MESKVSKFICAAIETFREVNNETQSKMIVGESHGQLRWDRSDELWETNIHGFLDGNGEFYTRQYTNNYDYRNLNSYGNISKCDLNLKLGQKYANEYNLKHSHQIPPRERKYSYFAEIYHFVNGTRTKEYTE